MDLPQGTFVRLRVELKSETDAGSFKFTTMKD